MDNKYLELGTIFRQGGLLDASGNNITHAVRKVVADHRRSLQGPYGPMAGKRVTNLPDGTVIITTVNPFGLAPTMTSQVFIPTREVIEETVECPYISGLFKFGSISDEGLFSRIYPRVEHEDDGGFSTYGPWQDTPYIAGQVTEIPSLCNPYIFDSESLAYNRGSCYSGRMREYVQLLQGGKKPIKYNYQWCETHGIYVNDIDGSWWIISIKSGEGVTAWKASTKCELDEEEQIRLGVTIPYLPSTAIPSEKLLLLSAAELADPYNGAWPFYPEHGWAFSYTGHEASLISITIHADGEHEESTLWSLTINRDPLTGDPESATLTNDESAYLWGPRTMAPKYPYFTFYGPTLLSYDIWKNADDPGGNKDAPLDVIYLSTGTRVVVRHTVLDDLTGDHVTSSNVPVGYGTACGGTMFLDSTLTGEYQDDTGLRTYYDTVDYEFDGIDKPEEADQQYYDVTTGRIIDYEVFQIGDWCYASGANITLSRAYSQYYGGESQAYNGGHTNYIRQETFFKPLLDRELLGLYRGTKKDVNRGAGWSYSMDRFAGGYYYGTVGSGVSPNPALPAGCAGGAYKYEETSCAQDFTATNLGSILHFPLNGIHPMDGFYTGTVPSGTCPSGVRTLLHGCFTEPVHGGGCDATEIVAPSSYEVDNKEDTWLFDTKELEWKNVSTADDTFETINTWSSYVIDPSIGVIQFYAFLDVFTGNGVTYKDFNLLDFADTYVWGNVSNYSMDDYPLTLDVGWFGIPFIPA